MKSKLNFWITHLALTVVASFLFNGGVFAGDTGNISLSKGNMGAIKLSSQNHNTVDVKGKNLIMHHQARQHLGLVHRAIGPQKEKR